MNDFARHSGDSLFNRVMIGLTIGAAFFALYIVL